MKIMHLMPIIAAITLLVSSCGADGDPGKCYVSIDWESFDDNYGVMYYEDTNPAVPGGVNLQRNKYYLSEPGVYNYYYESEDYDYRYTYDGTYELVQDPGTPSGFFTDGADGEDEFLEIYLTVYAKKGMDPVHRSELHVDGMVRPQPGLLQPAYTETRHYEQRVNGIPLKVKQTLRAYRK